MRIRRICVLGICAGVLSGVCLYGINSGWTKQDTGQKRDVITSVPQVISCVQKINVTKTEILNAGKENATVEVEVENTSDIGIIAITMTTKKGREAFTVSLRTSFEEDKEQIVVIEPHKTATLRMAVSNVYKDQPLEIGSVMYADGSEEGCQSSLKMLHDIRDEAKSQKKRDIPQ